MWIFHEPWSRFAFGRQPLELERVVRDGHRLATRSEVERVVCIQIFDQPQATGRGIGREGREAHKHLGVDGERREVACESGIRMGDRQQDAEQR